MATPDGPPPSRFRVEERGGRLVVIDMVTGATPPTAQERQAAWGDQDDAVRDTAGGTPILYRPKVAAPDPAPAPAGRTMSSTPHALGTDGTTITTRQTYDVKGPRRVTLSASAVAKLQVAAMVVVALTFLVFILAYTFDLTLVLVVTIVVLGKVFSQAIAKVGANVIDRLSQA